MKITVTIVVLACLAVAGVADQDDMSSCVMLLDYTTSELPETIRIRTASETIEIRIPTGKPANIWRSECQRSGGE